MGLSRETAAAIVAGLGIAVVPPPPRAVVSPSPVVWSIDNVQRIGGHPVVASGAPRVVETLHGAALEFDGVDDGVFIEANPLEGLERFTIEVLLRPAAGGPEEQRFLHIEEADTGNRALVELRMLPDGSFCLDTFLKHGASSLTLIDRTARHAAGEWHTAALSFDGRTMSHYVDGVKEASGEVAFKPLKRGRASIGVRQNRVSWFKGTIAIVRVSPEAADERSLLKPADRVVRLWPEGVPGCKADRGNERVVDGRITNVHDPTLTVIPPAGGTASGTAMIICPGGGYVRLAVANEAEELAERFRRLGVASFILKYRLSDYGHPAPLQDALRAIRLVRSRAQEFGIRPDRVGIFGASAGGHLAALTATLYDSPEARGNTPPVFLVHTAEDVRVPVEHSLLLYAALRRAGVPSELHVYKKGVHGFGLRADVGRASGWPEQLEGWLRAYGWIE